jgi:hypothetical protein
VIDSRRGVPQERWFYRPFQLDGPCYFDLGIRMIRRLGAWVCPTYIPCPPALVSRHPSCRYAAGRFRCGWLDETSDWRSGSDSMR